MSSSTHSFAESLWNFVGALADTLLRWIALATITTLVTVFLLAVAVPNYRCMRSYRIRPNARACFANQKTIAGAIEMYNLDFDTNITRLTPELFEEFRAKGYLQSLPDDPGYGPGTTDHYHYSQDSEYGVRCRFHGPIRPYHRDGVALSEHLEESGVDPWIYRSVGDLERERERYGWVWLLLGVAAGAAGTLTVLRLADLASALEDADEGASRPTDRNARNRWWRREEPAPWQAIEVISEVESPSNPRRPLPSGARCPVCACGFGPSPTAAMACPDCGTPHHKDCLDFNRGCGRYACGG